uniref:Protein kinase domain-containing protein n=1 Tax=Ciona savignyi TaxID=51511 RepID=H2Z0H0_CIOSA
MANMPKTIGQYKYKDFTDKKVLGSDGSFNDAYQVYHPFIGNCVVKIVSRSFYCQEGEHRQLLQEAADMRKVVHPNILPMLGVVMEPEHLCLIFDLAENGSLAKALKRIQIPWSVKVQIAYQTIKAICFLHNLEEPIVHRNLKTTNILLNTNFDVKVCDFVMPNRFKWVSQASKQKERSVRHRQTQNSHKEGSGAAIAYISPETIKNINSTPEPPFDVYSYGVLLVELLTDKQPFSDKTTKEVFDHISNGYGIELGEFLPGHP